MNQVALTAPITLAAFHSSRRLNEQRGWQMSNNQPEETKEKPGTVTRLEPAHRYLSRGCIHSAPLQIPA